MSTSVLPENATASMRLQRFLARAGIASRRKCEELIVAGRIAVNGHIVTELGTKIDPVHDHVFFDGVPVVLPDVHECVVLALNKPAGFLTAMRDERTDRIVSALVPTERFAGLFPVGRLDRDTTGLLLFTNDGDLGHALLHPSQGVYKRYIAVVDGIPTDADLRTLAEGVELSDGITAPAYVERLDNDASGYARVALEIHEGRKRQVRRMLSAVGHEVRELERTAFGPITLTGLKQGAWRRLEPDEVAALYAICDTK